MSYFEAARNYPEKKQRYWVLRAEERDRLEDALGVDGDMVHTCTSRKGHLCKDCLQCVRVYRRWAGEAAVAAGEAEEATE